MRKLVRVLAVASVCLAFIAAPAAAAHDERNHGPMPVAFVGALFGAPMFLVSLPFTALLAPRHIADSFDEMVARPILAMIGAKTPGKPCLTPGNAAPSCQSDHQH